MGGPNWMRVLSCGLLAGAVWTLLAAILVSLVGQDFLQAVTRGRAIPSTVSTYLFASDIAAGVWAMWLYASIRPRYGPGPRTAVLAATAWWIVTTLQSGKWVALLALDPSLAAPLLGNLGPMVVAALVGARAYHE